MDSYDQPADRGNRGKTILVIILVVAALAAIGAYVMSQNDGSENSTQTQVQQEATEESHDDLEAKFDSEVPETQRTVYFQADTSTEEDPAAVDSTVKSVSAFYKENEGVKLTVNGSINDEVDPQAQDPEELALAKERAEKIKQELVEAGVKADDISVTTVYTFKQAGDTPAAAEAMARYRRTVTISLE